MFNQSFFNLSSMKMRLKITRRFSQYGKLKVGCCLNPGADSHRLIHLRAEILVNAQVSSGPDSLSISVENVIKHFTPTFAMFFNHIFQRLEISYQDYASFARHVHSFLTIN